MSGECVQESMSNKDLSIITPQHDREDGMDVSYTPTPELFDVLPYMSEDALVQLGLRCWSDDHYLFPHEWYDHIPEGQEVVSIMGKAEAFSKETHNNDKRFGVLSYGVVLANRDGWQSIDEDCMLCEMDQRTEWYAENDYCVVAEKLGGGPFVVSKRHGENVTGQEYQRIEGTVDGVFPDREWSLEVRMNLVKNHWHAHIVFDV